MRAMRARTELSWTNGEIQAREGEAGRETAIQTCEDAIVENTVGTGRGFATRHSPCPPRHGLPHGRHAE